MLRQGDRHDRLSVIGALTVAPRRRRLGRSWRPHRHNVRAAEALGFLRALRRHLPRGFSLMWDRSHPLRATGAQAWLTHHARAIHVDPLPGCAPELNPVEHVWGHTKSSDLPNLLPADLDDLEAWALLSLGRKRGQRHLLEAFLHAAGLEL